MAAIAKERKESTKIRALREAKGLIQSFGFNGFSFQHVADLLGIKKPSLYDHFKSKEELGKILLDDYATTFSNWAETVEPFGPREKIGAIFELFYKFSQDKNKMCMAVALGSDYNSLPKPMLKPLRGMIELRGNWMVSVIKEGQKKKIFRSDLSAEELAQFAICAGWGSQMYARVTVNPEQIKKVKETVLKMLDA